MQKLLPFFWIFLTLPLLGQSLEQQVDELFKSYDNDRAPGASVGIIKDGAFLLKKGYGLANLENGTPSADSTNYRLASLTKQFTAMAVMILAERGLLTYETVLTEIFADFPGYGQLIKIKHLLNHTAGLLDYEDLLPSEPYQVKDRDVLEIMKKQNRTYFQPGAQYRYSNTGYAILAMVVEQVSQQSFAQFLEENIFSPLAMHNTVAYESGISEVTNRAYGYSYVNNKWSNTDQSRTSAVLGDGGVYTSVNEYYLWDQALYTEKLVKKETLEQAFNNGRLNDGQQINYGFGWVIDQYRNLKRVSHTGSTIGFRSAVQRFPGQQFTVFVVVNREGASPWTIAQKIVDIVLFHNAVLKGSF